MNRRKWILAVLVVSLLAIGGWVWASGGLCGWTPQPSYVTIYNVNELSSPCKWDLRNLSVIPINAVVAPYSGGIVLRCTTLPLSYGYVMDAYFYNQAGTRGVKISNWMGAPVYVGDFFRGEPVKQVWSIQFVVRSWLNPRAKPLTVFPKMDISW